MRPTSLEEMESLVVMATNSKRAQPVIQRPQSITLASAQETLGLAEVWSRWVSMASPQSSCFWGPWMEDLEAMLLEAMETRDPWG